MRDGLVISMGPGVSIVAHELFPAPLRVTHAGLARVSKFPRRRSGPRPAKERSNDLGYLTLGLPGAAFDKAKADLA
jgi:hypothetical protein